MADWNRPLTPHEAERIELARQTAHRLYDGVEVAHRSCGIAMAETFGCATPAYQSLRKGGLFGHGSCGVVQGARQILGEQLGDPDPSGATTEVLKAAMADFDARVPERVRRATCNELTQDLGPFKGPVRHAHCTELAAIVAELLAEVLIRHQETP